MLVKTQSKGRSLTGINVGASNAQLYFPHGVSSIDLQLDQVQICCVLSPNFWHDEPEIYDSRLCAWLDAKHLSSRAGQGSVTLDLVPAGENLFCLRRMPNEDHSNAKALQHTAS